MLSYLSRGYSAATWDAAEAGAAAAAANSAATLVSMNSWMVVIWMLSPELSVKMKIDSLLNATPPGRSPYSLD